MARLCGWPVEARSEEPGVEGNGRGPEGHNFSAFVPSDWPPPPPQALGRVDGQGSTVSGDVSVATAVSGLPWAL